MQKYYKNTLCSLFVFESHIRIFIQLKHFFFYSNHALILSQGFRIVTHML